MKLDIFAAAVMNTVFWYIMPRGLVDIYRFSEQLYGDHLQ
jgi:hypothetical protein